MSKSELDKIFYSDEFLSKGLNSFIDEVKSKGLKVDKKAIEDYYNNQETVQIFKPMGKSNVHKILIYVPFQRVYIDSMYITHAKISLINIIDFFTKYAYIKVIRKSSVTAEDAKKAINEYINDIQNKGYFISNVYSDNGSEFKGEFDAFLKKQFINHIFTDPNDKRQTSPIETFNRTVRLSFEKYISVHGLDITKINDVFKKINDSYNNVKHSRTEFTPNEMLEDENKQEAFNNKNVKERETKNTDIIPLKVGSYVRLPRKKDVFDKLMPTWTKQLYKIEKFDKKTQRYVIEGVPYKYPQWMLQEVDKDKLMIYKPSKEGKSREVAVDEQKTERRVLRERKQIDSELQGNFYTKELPSKRVIKRNKKYD